jgi:hypothetical protein
MQLKILYFSTGYANHILNTGHRYGTISDTMRIIKAGKKGKHLNTSEKYYIHRASKNKLQLNDTNIDHNNPIFDTLHEIYTGPQHQQHTQKQTEMAPPHNQR